MISARGLAGLGLALLVGGWVAGCSSSKTVGQNRADAGGGDASAGHIQGCDALVIDSCTYNNVGCTDLNVTSLDTLLEDIRNNCSASVHVECRAGCIDSYREIATVPQPDSGNTLPPPVGTVSPFGAACDSDADCATGQMCLRADSSAWLTGGPSRGYCTLDCAADPAICTQFANSVCVQGAAATEAYCFEGCFRGPDDPLDPKCGGREDVACMQVSATTTTCQPVCGSDSQCPSGRFCDISTGVCVDDQPTGDAIGSLCDPTAQTDTCAGTCVDFGQGFAVCSGVCTVGLGAPGCGVDPNQGPAQPGDAICLPLFSANDDVGDVGLCLQRCDCNDNCLSSAAVCQGFTSVDTVAAFMSQGLCLPPEPVDGGAGLSCGMSDAGGGAPDSGGGGGNDAAVDATAPVMDATSPDSSTDSGDGG